jgi:outer membrane protein assembly factor BamA
MAPQRGTLRDAIVRVEEGPTGRLMLSGGFGSEAGALGAITLEESNFDIRNWPESWDDLWLGNAFRGGGQRFSLLLQAGTERSQYAIEFEEPAVGDGPYSAGISLYSRARIRNEFDETRTGIELSGGRGPSKFVRHELAVGFENIDISDTDALPDDISDDEGGHTKPFVRLRASEDRRDSRFMPTEGYYRVGELELSVGDVQVAKLRLLGEKYWVLSEQNGRDRHVLGLRGQFGAAVPLGGDVPVFERFYAGGFSTLRGFEFEGAAPSDPTTERLIGGESMLVGSLEYSFPIASSQQLRLVTFSDAGWVTEDLGEMLTGWDELRLSVGGGIRWQAPFLGTSTIEIDLAVPVVSQDDDQTQNLHFSLGAQRGF